MNQKISTKLNSKPAAEILRRRYTPYARTLGNKNKEWLVIAYVGALFSLCKRYKKHVRCNNRRSGMRVSTQTPIAVCDLPTLLGCPGAWRTCRFPPTKKKPGKALSLRPSWPNLDQLRPHTINSFSDLRVHGLDGAIFQFVSKTRSTPPDNGVS